MEVFADKAWKGELPLDEIKAIKEKQKAKAVLLCGALMDISSEKTYEIDFSERIWEPYTTPYFEDKRIYQARLQVREKQRKLSVEIPPLKGADNG